MEIVTEMLHKCVEENSHTALNQAEYDERYNVLAEIYENIKKGILQINDKRLERNVKSDRDLIFIQEYLNLNNIV